VKFNKGGLIARAGTLLAFFFSVGSPDSHAQQSQISPARGPAIPTLEALPHKPLPPGDFYGWCGLGGKVVLEIGNKRRDIYDGEAKASPLTFPMNSSVQCGDDGRTLAFIDDEAGSASEVDIAAGVVTRTLVTSGSYRGVLSFSPDLRSVTSNVLLTPVSKAVKLNIISFPVTGKYAGIHRFEWSRDSTAFFGLTSSNEKSHDDTIQIFNTQHRRIASGSVPAGFLFSEGWFANSQNLYLYVNSVHDEFGAGFMYRCTIAPWKCQQFASNVLAASVGGKGVLAMVRAVGKYSDDGEVIKYPPKYTAEILNSALQVVARQTLKSGERNGLALNVDPSGTRAAFTWYRNVPCPPGNPEDDLCTKGRKEGIMIDLSGALK
jgi:hypothetical protein